MRHARRRGPVAPHLVHRARPLLVGLTLVGVLAVGAGTGGTLAAWTDDVVVTGGTVGAAAVVATTTTPVAPDIDAVAQVGWAAGDAPLRLDVRNDGTVAYDLHLVVGPLAADGTPPTTQRPRSCPGSVWRTATVAVDDRALGALCRLTGTLVATQVPAGAETVLVLDGARAGTAEPLHVVATDSASGRFVDTAVVVDVTPPGSAARGASDDAVPAPDDGAAEAPAEAPADGASEAPADAPADAPTTDAPATDTPAPGAPATPAPRSDAPADAPQEPAPEPAVPPGPAEQSDRTVTVPAPPAPSTAPSTTAAPSAPAARADGTDDVGSPVP
ncbi:SipW-dependent-type signal peptide-containing protein [Jannaschia sp. R86511]|uniref:SipW-dependent-type signal peptide-containing protein n=1 Tax=Jannaschia sp. R86511 TaxID=3093853 RepID=UPI0036D4014F